MKNNFNELLEHLKRHGFFFQNSEIYGGLSNSWDYGPLGVEIKNKLKKIWWKFFISNFDFNYGLDSSILMNPNVWKASGHIDNFSDPLIDCKNCKNRFRPDKLIELKINEDVSNLEESKITDLINKLDIKCPKCNKKDFTDVRKFKLMFNVNNSITNSSNNDLYLRPETAQGIFVNFKNIQRTMSAKLPFGVGQIGKSFRNEITPSNFIFRTREFEQMELEFFYSKYDKKDWFSFWQDKINIFLCDILKIKKENLVIKEHSLDKLAHYAKKTVDFNYKFPFGEGELWGIANRGDYDLSCHEKTSKKDLKYFDQDKKEKYLPFIIEPSVGVDRLLLSILCDSFVKEKNQEKERVFLKLNYNLAPIDIFILPLVKNDELIKEANELASELNNLFSVKISASGSIGKRYVKADAIGTPFCITYDYESLKDNSVTVRFRDSMHQERIEIKKIKNFLVEKFNL